MDTATEEKTAGRHASSAVIERDAQNESAMHEPASIWTDIIPEGSPGGYWFYPGDDDDL